MKLFLMLLVLVTLSFGDGKRIIPRPHESRSVQYYTKRNHSIEIHIMFHVDPMLAVQLAKQYRSRNRNKLKEVIPKILKEVERYFQHPTMNQTVRFHLMDTKFIRNNNNILRIDENASKYLKSYCDWQSKKKFSKKRWYYSVLLTALDLFYLNSHGEEVRRSTGRGYMSGMCSMKKSCTLIEWHCSNMGYLLAHEIAHSLGVNHDDVPPNRCRGNHVMRSSYNDLNQPKSWSECSRQALKRYLQSGKSWCIKPENQK